jgi:hypothetical protein
MKISMASGIARNIGAGPGDERLFKDQRQMLSVLEGDEKPNGLASKILPKTFFKTGDFEKKLRWMIENPGVPAERWRITPKMAEVMLGWNTRNRPVAAGKVKQYANLMRDGRWRYTGEPIIFSRLRLIDGQKRLAAAIMSGATIDALVVFAVGDDAFPFIDVGQTRTAGDIFAINGVKNYSSMSAATQFVVGYENGQYSAAANMSVARGDHDQLYQSYLKHSSLQDSSWVVSVFGRVKLISPSMMCAIHYLCARKARAEADDFFRKVGEGLGFTGKKDPAYKLHKALVDAAVSGERFGRKAGAAITIKSWNAARQKRDPGPMRFGADETFPRVI